MAYYDKAQNILPQRENIKFFGIVVCQGKIIKQLEKKKKKIIITCIASKPKKHGLSKR